MRYLHAIRLAGVTCSIPTGLPVPHAHRCSVVVAAASSEDGDADAPAAPKPRSGRATSSPPPAVLKGRFSRRRSAAPSPRQHRDAAAAAAAAAVGVSPSKQRQQRYEEDEDPSTEAAERPPSAAQPGWYEVAPGSSASSSGTHQSLDGSTPDPTTTSTSGTGAGSASSGGSGDGAAAAGAVVAAELARLSPRQLQQLNDYLDYMLEVNQNMNLTGEDLLGLGLDWEVGIGGALTSLQLQNIHLR